MIDAFVVRAALAGVGVAVAAAPLGCFVVWRRMAYFGDATAHAALLGVALALAFSLPIALGTFLVAVAMGLVVSALGERGHTMDTALAVVAHSALAVALVVVSFMPDMRVGLDAWLFGDLLVVTALDVMFIWLGALLVSALLAWRWSAWLLVTLSPDLAVASGINPQRERLLLTLALAVVVAVAIRVVGALLVTSLLIVPAASARVLASSPERMALLAIAVGVSAALGGLTAAWYLDTPTGPTIVVMAAVAFCLSNAVAVFRKRG